MQCKCNNEMGYLTTIAEDDSSGFYYCYWCGRLLFKNSESNVWIEHENINIIPQKC
jgi:hypothetical protein